MKKILLIKTVSWLFCNVGFAKWKVNKPYQVFITSDELAENIKFYQSSKNMSLCKKNTDEANDQSIKFSTNQQRRSIKETFNKTFTDWEVMDEYAEVMNDFALATCKTMIYGNDKEKKELLDFIIELTKLEKFFKVLRKCREIIIKYYCQKPKFLHTPKYLKPLIGRFNLTFTRLVKNHFWFIAGSYINL